MNKIDIDEKALYKKYPRVFNLLLKDNTTKENIIWATDSYLEYGYNFNDQINPKSITELDIIKPRSEKEKYDQIARARSKGEVFTPSWMCNKQNNIVDNDWFGYNNPFNRECDNLTWKTTSKKIAFKNGKTWIDYIKDIRLEIACGEAPYLCSRYDTVNGILIPLSNRIGMLDRKFRILNENASTDEEWLAYSFESIKSIYGFEWQGDNLLLARENVLFTFIDNYYFRFKKMPGEQTLYEVAFIISWNIFQMDGLKGVIPNSCKAERNVQLDIFGNEIYTDHQCVGCEKNNILMHNGIYVRAMDWEKNIEILFIDLLRRT